MKKLLFGFVAVVAFGLNVNAKEVVSTEKSSDKETVVSSKSDSENLLKIKVHIEFGRKSRNCQGFGICTFDGEIEIDTPIGFYASTDGNGRVNLEVTKDGLETLNKVFGSQTIIIEEDFVLSEGVCKELGVTPGYTIKTGKYSVKKSTFGTYYVTI